MQKNTQIPEKRELSGPGTSLAVNSIFYTIQGEGPFAGTPSVFVRLAGCNLQCPLCDTEYTTRTEMPVEDIIRRVREVQMIRSYPEVACTPQPEVPIEPVKLVVISGGEPFRQDISILTCRLLHFGYKVQVETNGSFFNGMMPFNDPNLTIVCSPKTGKINPKLMRHIKALKYVATADSLEGSADGLPLHALEHPVGMLARPNEDFRGEIYLQPVDEKNTVRNNRNLTAVVESCMTNGYRLCLQVHKIIGVD